MTDKDYFRLDINAPIFETLANNPPSWWNTLCQDQDLYINIRKDNRINVYYKGASVMDLYFPKKEFKARIHSQYLNSDWGATKSYYKTEPEKIVADISRIKANIDTFYKTKALKPEGGNEKEIQGGLYTGGKYIDTEYAFVYPDSDLIIRIDLITINENGNIEFVELKRISDNRLLHQEDSEKQPKILKQIQDYNDFITKHKDKIESYYRKLQLIMKKLRINNPLLDCEIKGVSPNIRLLFVGYSDGKSNHPKRRNRVKRIADLLKESGIISNIDKI